MVVEYWWAVFWAAAVVHESKMCPTSETAAVAGASAVALTLWAHMSSAHSNVTSKWGESNGKVAIRVHSDTAAAAAEEEAFAAVCAHSFKAKTNTSLHWRKVQWRANRSVASFLLYSSTISTSSPPNDSACFNVSAVIMTSRIKIGGKKRRRNSANKRKRSLCNGLHLMAMMLIISTEMVIKRSTERQTRHKQRQQWR